MNSLLSYTYYQIPKYLKIAEEIKKEGFLNFNLSQIGLKLIEIG